MRRPLFLVCLILTSFGAAACQRRPTVAVIGLAESLQQQVRVAVEQINSLNERGGL